MLLGFGVILGFLALSLDVGNLMWERRQVQNGADAAAQAVAKACAKKVAADCTGTSPVAATMNNANAADGTTSTDLICARGVAGIPTCPAVAPVAPKTAVDVKTKDLGQCPLLPDYYVTGAGKDVPYVEVHSGTRTSGGGSSLPGFVLKAVTGSSSSVHVPACARAAYGNFTSGSVLPLTFSYCEYDDAIAKVGYGDPTVSLTQGETALALKYKTGGGGTDPCPDLGHAGMDTPGGFGWLDQLACLATVNEGGWVNIDTGKSGPAGCLQVGKVFMIPVFDCVSKAQVNCDNISGGANTYYHVLKFAAFYVTGWEFPGNSQFLAGPPPWPLSGADEECKAEAGDKKSCLYGMFLKDYVAPGGSVGPPTGDPNAPKVILPIS